MKRQSLKIPDVDYEKIREQALREQRTITVVISRAIDFYIAAHAESERATAVAV